ncbi:MAG TPA: aminotransferase class V-fold PLP-dependent enzyme, partial [Labilithrix sp.]|nr:aminotransferase class V-fold PLP-dependent enzyme [Labilithrix sp.]
PIPSEALEDLDEYRRTLSLRKRAIPTWVGRIEELSAMVETLLGAPAGSVALRESATGGQASIAAAISARPEKNRIVTTSLDFHSSRYMWRAQARRGFELQEVEPADGVEIATDRIVAAIDERTAIVAAALVSPRTGALLDIRPVIEAAHKVGAIVVLDVYQAAGIVPIDVRTLDADVIVGGTHKWLGGGGTGLSFLYVRPELANRLEPAYPGWIGHASVLSFADEYVPAPGARRFQVGMPAMEPIYTARAGLRTVLEVGVDAIRKRNLALIDRIIERARSHDLRVRVPRSPEARAGFVCIDAPRAEVIVNRLDSQGIDIDYRPGAGLRVGPHYCHREDECDRVVNAIAEGSRK